MWVRLLICGKKIHIKLFQNYDMLNIMLKINPYEYKNRIQIIFSQVADYYSSWKSVHLYLKK